MTRGVADGGGADDIAVVERARLPSTARNSRADEGVRREWNRLHLPLDAYVERIRPYNYKHRQTTQGIRVQANGKDDNFKKFDATKFSATEPFILEDRFSRH